MLRIAVKRVTSMINGLFKSAIPRFPELNPKLDYSTGTVEHMSEDEFNQCYIDYLLREDIDDWEVRKIMNDLMGMDLIPDPKVVEAGLRAARKLNDIALAIRWLEGCKEKCADEVMVIYPYILQNIRPTLNELGIPTPEELCYDKPELAMESVFDM